MIQFGFVLFSIFAITNMILFDFNNDSILTNWRVIDDVVMGGRSNGSLNINAEGNAVFRGKVSLQNNGGFSSIRYQFEQREITSHEKISIRLKGDGKAYQFRVKSNKRDRHNYIFPFKTSGNWETSEIPLNDMTPTFRGRKLNILNYNGEVMEEVAILIGNKQAESFRLEIDKIWLK